MSTTSFYRRPLPEGCEAFASPEGRRLFREALDAGGMEGWFALAEQFHTQSDPAFCGLGTLVVALNALAIDPGRIWKGPWRWYAEDLLDCCLPLDRVKTQGVTLDELACLARCNGARASVVRVEGAVTADGFRDIVQRAGSTPRGPVLVVSYSRAALGQTGDGHFSPLGGYHADRDLVLLMDVARFKYPPHWVPVERLFEAMRRTDAVTGKPRGWIELDRSETPVALLFRLALDRGDLTAEHRAALERLIENLRSTPAWRAVPAEANDDLERAAATALLLALPESVVATLTPSARGELERMRRLDEQVNTLSDDLAELRAQLAALACSTEHATPTVG